MFYCYYATIIMVNKDLYNARNILDALVYNFYLFLPNTANKDFIRDIPEFLITY